MARQDYSYAIDKRSQLINVKDAVKGDEYSCPCCGLVMIPRQGCKRKWHFAHKGNLENCSYETYLHKIAKKRICECFNKAPQFNIRFHPKFICNIAECPLGASCPCSWHSTKEYDLKQYYNQCEEEVMIGKYRADLFIYNRETNRPPVIIEICVTHKSTEEKLNLNYRIIEIRIESEDDIDQIVSTLSIKEDEVCALHWGKRQKDKIRFYNFRVYSEKPDKEHQAPKYRFWIDSKGFFHGDRPEDYGKCLSPNPAEIENSRFRIESNDYIDRDFAFSKLAESGLGIKYCTMCDRYRFNDRYDKPICILYKSKGTKQFPRLSDAMSCQNFKQKNYAHEGNLSYNREYKITVR